MPLLCILRKWVIVCIGILSCLIYLNIFKLPAITNVLLQSCFLGFHNWTSLSNVTIFNYPYTVYTNFCRRKKMVVINSNDLRGTSPIALMWLFARVHNFAFSRQSHPQRTFVFVFLESLFLISKHDSRQFAAFFSTVCKNIRNYWCNSLGGHVNGWSLPPQIDLPNRQSLEMIEGL